LGIYGKKERILEEGEGKTNLRGRQNVEKYLQSEN